MCMEGNRMRGMERNRRKRHGRKLEEGAWKGINRKGKCPRTFVILYSFSHIFLYYCHIPSSSPLSTITAIVHPLTPPPSPPLLTPSSFPHHSNSPPFLLLLPISSLSSSIPPHSSGSGYLPCSWS